MPFGDSTEVHGGNNFGVVVGDFTSGSRTLGFIDRGGQFIEISADFVGSNTVHAFGVNDAGTVVGTFVDPRNGSATEGFIETKNGADTVFSVHGAIETDARAIDSFGDVVGFFKDSNGAFHGFERFTNGDIFTFDTPFGGTNTRALGINDAGQIVGSLVLPGDPGFEETIGFIDTNGVFTLVAGPSTATPSFSEADGINNFGEVSGFSLSSTGKEQAFVGQIVEDAFGRVPVSINGNTVTTPFTPVGPVGINDSGQLFGSFQNGVTHGFVSSNVTGVFGVAGAATPVTINAFQSEVDPDATLTVTISNIPTGMTFNHGVTSDKGATVTLAQSDLAGLTLTSGFGSFDLTVTASVTDGGTATASSAPTTLHVEVSRLGAAAALHAAVLQSPAADSTLHVAGTTNLDASAGSTAVNSSSLPMDFHQGAPVDLTAQLDARFGAGSTPSTGGNPVLFKAGGPTTLGGTHTGDFITSVLEHAQHTAQLPVH